MIQLIPLKDDKKIYLFTMSDFDTSETVNEEELNSLDLKKKDDALLDVDVDDVVDPDVISTEEDEAKEASDKGMFIDDPELEEYMSQNRYEDAY